MQQIPHQQQQQQQYVQPQQQMQPTPQQAQPTSRGTPEADRICAAAEQADPIGALHFRQQDAPCSLPRFHLEETLRNLTHSMPESASVLQQG